MPVLGLKGVGNFNTPDERPKNYREVMLLLFPNASAPLTALLSKLKDEPTTDPEFKVFTKILPTQRTLDTGGEGSGATTIGVTAGTANIFKAGHAVLEEATGEIMWVTQDPVSPFNAITVVRGKGTTAAALTIGDGLLIVGNHNAEGASIPTSVLYDPVVVNNFTQIFRTVLAITNTARQTNLRYGKYEVEAKREALELHSIEMEKAYIFGSKVEDTSGSQPNRTTGGINSFITTNVQDFGPAGSNGVSIDGWENFLEGVFKVGSNEKLFLCGARALNVCNKLGRVHSQIEVAPTDETYGMHLLTWITPFGTLQIKQHPLFSQNPTFTSWGFVIDPKYIVYRFLQGRDTQYLQNRQAAGDDATKNEFLTEAGLEVQFESVHAVAKNMTAFAA